MTKPLYGVTDAATGQTVYINPDTVRFVLPNGHRTTLVFSETHTLTVTADLQALIDGGLFKIL
ncbi:hypothetical protein AAE026_13005 [Bradyrhizobium sp. DN5]|uniref:hypothetical protein n=1 Tax=unclassified Bradyrhizobium TaxID=2631580 RepID=UPI00087E425B|nr:MULTISPECIES: hypothetical protein [unclassified Bradyrhizobium]SDJ74018.1 hypothetical protein SAMN05216338_10639 [Bradyrhizobium sp. Rc2d]